MEIYKITSPLYGRLGNQLVCVLKVLVTHAVRRGRNAPCTIILTDLPASTRKLIYSRIDIHRSDDAYKNSETTMTYEQAFFLPVDHRLSEYEDYLADHFGNIFRSDRVDVPSKIIVERDDVLTIHSRSGDIARADPAATGYYLLPVAFFLRVAQDHQFSHLHIVAENPAFGLVSALVERAESVGLTTTVQHSPCVVQDWWTLQHARNVVVDLSTLTTSAILFHTQPAKVFQVNWFSPFSTSGIHREIYTYHIDDRRIYHDRGWSMTEDVLEEICNSSFAIHREKDCPMLMERQTQPTKNQKTKCRSVYCRKIVKTIFPY